MGKLIVFDVDGTLCESRKEADDEMVQLLNKLSNKFTIALLSGADKERIFNQVANKVSFIPYIGEYSSARTFYENEIICDYKFNLNDMELIKRVFSQIDQPLSLLDISPHQITFYIVNPNIATEQERDKADPNGNKRRIIINKIRHLLSNYNVRIGGKTSIDVTLKGVSKKNGVDELKKYLNLMTKDILFIGDRCFSGGNDYMEMQYDFKQVLDVDHTKMIIRRLLR